MLLGEDFIRAVKRDLIHTHARMEHLAQSWNLSVEVDVVVHEHRADIVAVGIVRVVKRQRFLRHGERDHCHAQQCRQQQGSELLHLVFPPNMHLLPSKPFVNVSIAF